MSMVDVCDDLVEFVESRPTDWDVYVEKQYLHIFERKNLPEDKLSVYVIGSQVGFISDNRAGERSDYEVFVVFQKKIDDPSPTTIDPLMVLSEEIAYAIRRQIYFGDAACVGPSELELYQGQLERHRQFAAVLALDLQKTTVED